MEWASFVVASKYESGVLYFLVQDSINTNPRYSHQKVQTKFPGGKNRDHPEDKTFLDTARREFHEETHLDLPDGNLLVIDDIIKGFHRKVFYHVNAESLTGELRKKTKRDVNSIMYPPRWFRVGPDLEKLLYTTHRRAYREAVKILLSQAHVLVV